MKPRPSNTQEGLREARAAAIAPAAADPAMVASSSAPSPFYTAEHEAFRQTVRRFVDREIMPFVDQWDEAEEFPRELYGKASAAGLMQLGFPEEYGGVPTDPFFGIIKAGEMARHGSGGLNASLNSHTIGAPPIAALGPEWMKRKLLPEILGGEKISALAITEPSGNMVVDIGGGRCEAAIISMFGLVVSNSVRVAGDRLDDTIAVARELKARGVDVVDCSSGGNIGGAEAARVRAEARAMAQRTDLRTHGARRRRAPSR